MKSIKYLFILSIFALVFTSCEDEDKNPLPTPPNGVFVMMDVISPVINVTDLENSAYEFSISTLSNNVESYTLSVGINGGESGVDE